MSQFPDSHWQLGMKLQEKDTVHSLIENTKYEEQLENKIWIKFNKYF